jgi:hypothetical protein
MAEFFAWLKKQRAAYCLSLNGPDETEANSIFVPEHLFDRRIDLPNGNSPARRLSGMSAPPVTDSLYVRMTDD